MIVKQRKLLTDHLTQKQTRLFVALLFSLIHYARNTHAIRTIRTLYRTHHPSNVDVSKCMCVSVCECECDVVDTTTLQQLKSRTCTPSEGNPG